MDVATEMPKEETITSAEQRVLCKFLCHSVTNYGTKQHMNLKAELNPVYGAGENESFSKYTPSGKLELLITNPTVEGFFEPGEQYYIEIKKAS